MIFLSPIICLNTRERRNRQNKTYTKLKYHKLLYPITNIILRSLNIPLLNVLVFTDRPNACSITRVTLLGKIIVTPYIWAKVSLYDVSLYIYYAT